jgi:putative ABC transport system ATP-binding protein
MVELPSGGPAGAPPPLVQARGLTRVYRLGRSEVRALDGVDLDVLGGEVLAVCGVSGSGKSTLLHLLGGLDTPTAGSVRVAGRELSGLSSYERSVHRRTQVGFVFQAFHLVPRLSALDNVALALTFQGVFGAARERRAREALEAVGLGPRAAHRPSELSGGEQQRVAVARALVNDPAILLADEPTGNLDRETAGEIVAWIRRVNRELGTTVVVVTHDEHGVARHADRQVELADGRLAPAEARA